MLRDLIEKLKEIRTEKKVTHSELSLRTGVSQKHISNIENHKTIPSVEIIRKLAAGLGEELCLDINVKDSNKQKGVTPKCIQPSGVTVAKNF